MTTKDSHVGEILERLESSTGLQLKVEENDSGFSLLHIAPKPTSL